MNDKRQWQKWCKAYRADYELLTEAVDAIMALDGLSDKGNRFIAPLQQCMTHVLELEADKVVARFPAPTPRDVHGRFAGNGSNGDASHASSKLSRLAGLRKPAMQA